MKIAFHFSTDNELLGGSYGYPIRQALFRILLRSRTIDVHSKVFQGDLLLSMLTMDREKTESGEIRRFNQERFLSSIETLLNPGSHIWLSFDQEAVKKLKTNNVFIIFFESLSFTDALEIDNELQNIPYYLGALQVDETCEVHWVAYSNSLVASYRVIGKTIHCFWDGICEDSKHEGELEELREIGFQKVEFEALNGKFTIFDKYHDFQHARRVAELNNALSDSLAFLADQVITRLSDSAPEIGNKLWSAIRTYDRAEVNEEYAQVAVSCRRIIEYVSDQLFPPQNEEINGRKMGKTNFRNRLLAYADHERSSDTNIDLVCISTEALAKQLEKLSNLSNKGVHAEVYRHEARRCLLRTIMVLDDIVSLKAGPFEIKLTL